ncbi:hypothetical protein CHS0354_032292 [Potamilus streckersoni]|uniref:Vitelline membrane outer layer protein 1 homolog n=1 Tax=Potamilus streckersoni TaxID=2493646 RepID=A0AAE0VH45_9BIVA|nr:hypothetical protein CHS0354_032292 [Potamilus streckersoni]
MVDVFIFLSLVVLGDTLFLIPSAPRSAGKILAVGNGGRWGSWYQPQYCPNGTYAVGYNMKIQGEQQDRDDTGLNAISLRCQPLSISRDVGDITSEEGGWGTWIGWTMCNFDNKSERTFLTSFSLQVEVNQDNDYKDMSMWKERVKNKFSGDDTAADFVKFMCRDFNSNSQERELSHPPGHGAWGSYGDWSQSCPLNSAICGIQTKVEPFQGDGSLFGGDDTALNDVQFICCNDTTYEM